MEIIKNTLKLNTSINTVASSVIAINTFQRLNTTMNSYLISVTKLNNKLTVKTKINSDEEL